MPALTSAAAALASAVICATPALIPATRSASALARSLDACSATLSAAACARVAAVEATSILTSAILFLMINSSFARLSSCATVCCFSWIWLAAYASSAASICGIRLRVVAVTIESDPANSPATAPASSCRAFNVRILLASFSVFSCASNIAAAVSCIPGRDSAKFWRRI